VGAVTSGSATIIFKAQPNTKLEVTYKCLPAGSSFAEQTTVTTDADGWGKLILKGLEARCRYSVSIGQGNPPPTFSFRTFPAEGTVLPFFRFAFGACSDNEDLPEMPALIHAQNYKPEFFLHVGDWGYPDTTDRPMDDAKRQNYYACYPSEVEKAYVERYTHPVMRPILQSMPVDYVYDDHDFVNDNSGGYFCSYYLDKKRGPFDAPTPPNARRNVIDFYTRRFPHYDLPDTSQGIYHKFVYGNCEFFMLDLRANRTSPSQSVVKKGDVWVFDPQPQHTIMGSKQWAWLQAALASSKAQWKFIISSVTFNVAMGDMLQAFLREPKQQFKRLMGIINYPAANMATVMADGWSGYPLEQEKVLNFCRDKQIRNVVVLSGDTHITGTDDGANGGLPEMMSGGITEATRISYYIAKWLGLNQWNSGIQGVTSKGFVNSFGGVEVFGSDSIRLVAVSEKGDTLSRLTLYDGLLATPEVVLAPDKPTVANLSFFHPERLDPNHPVINPYFPKPKKKQLKQAVMTVYNDQGQKLYEQANLKLKGKSLKFPLVLQPGKLKPGYYFVTVSTPDGQFAKRLYLPAK